MKTAEQIHDLLMSGKNKEDDLSIIAEIQKEAWNEAIDAVTDIRYYMSINWKIYFPESAIEELKK